MIIVELLISVTNGDNQERAEAFSKGGGGGDEWRVLGQKSLADGQWA